MNTQPPLSQVEFSELMNFLKLRGEGALAVAVSGGADSMALALLLGEWCKERDIPLTALTVDHGLRKEAAEEAQKVHSWLAAHNIPHVILQWRGEKPHSNIQDQARLARYGLMGEWCGTNGVNKLFLAHHQGDQAETFLIRLFRGSGIDGLSAMKAIADFPVFLPNTLAGEKLMIYRPLLSVSKERLEAALRDRGQAWVEDPSNQNESYTRIKVRNLLKNSDIVGLSTERMAQTAGRMARVQSLLQSLTDDLIQDSVTYYPEGYVEIKRSPLMAAHDEIALRLLSFVIRRTSGGNYVPRLARLEALYDRLSDADFTGQTLGGCLISPLKNNLIMISREVSAIYDEFILELNSIKLWDGRFIVENNAATGTLKRLELSDWQKLRLTNPEIRKLKLHKSVRDSLPCLITENGDVILPDFIAGYEQNGLKVTFRQ